MSKSKQRQLEAAIAAAQAKPDNDDAWDNAEALAAELESPDSVAVAYRDALDGELAAGLALHLGERAVAFCEEWFGEDPARLADILGRVLEIDLSPKADRSRGPLVGEIDPRSEWAFQKLTVVLTVAGQWARLLELYDRTIEASESSERKKRLLREAYESARDLADRPDKAIEYLQQLYDLAPTDKRADALEKLLERHERWVELIALWEERLEDLAGKSRVASQMRIATTWLEKLDKSREALTAMTRLIGESGDPGEEALAVLERILTATSASTRVRTEALDLLRSQYEHSDEPRQVVRVLELAIPLVGTTKRRALHRECGERLSVLGDNRAALEHYAELLALEPHSAATQRAMRSEAQACSNYLRYADGVAAAAEVTKDVDRRVSLLDDAAQVRLDYLSDEPGAIGLLLAALAEAEIGAASVLHIGRKLNQLLEGAGRTSERLQVLEQMADAESVPSSRRALIGDLARLAETHGEADRALAAWSRRRSDDPDDLEALDATIALLEKERRWQPLNQALEDRVKRSDRPSERRADLVRIATVEASELGEKEKALAVWLRIQEEFGEDPEIIAALSELLAATERWDEHTALLERTSTEQTGGLAARLAELGQTYLEQLGKPEAGLRCFRRAVGVEPTHERAQAGLTRLLEDPAHRPAAAEALSRALRDNEDWAGFLALTEPRLAGARVGEHRRAILCEAADIHLQHTGDRRAALDYTARAFPLGPTDRAIEDQLVALAAEVGDWQTALESYRGAIGAVAGDSGAQGTEMGLRLRAAAVVEEKIGDRDTALSTYLSCCHIQPDRRQAVAAAIRLGIRLGRHPEAAAAFVGYTVSTEQLDSALISALGESDGEDLGTASADALEEAAAAASAELPARISAELAWQVARWRQHHGAEPARIARALERVVELDPGRAEAWRELAALRRERGGEPLLEALERLTVLEPKDLDVAVEAAEVALESLPGPEHRERREAAVSNLHVRAAAAWKGAAPAGSATRDPAESTRWAIERQVDEHRAAGAPERALDLLIEAARLPWGDEGARDLRLQAAAIAERELDDPSAAIEILQAVSRRDPRDVTTRDRLASLYRAGGRLSELFALRADELALGPQSDRRLALRLEMAELLDQIERREGRVKVLRANLAEIPGHPPTIDLLTRLLEEGGRFAELADIVEDQAARLESNGDGARAAELWNQTAHLAEEGTRDRQRALVAYRKVAELADNGDAVAAIARIHLELDQPLEAVPWLERSLARAERDEQSDIAMTLADAHLSAEQPEQAIDALVRTVRAGHAPLPVRQRLADLYRQAERWEELGDLINETVPLVYDKKAAFELAREAGAIFRDRIEAPERALPALQRAVELNPSARDLRLLLGESLRAGGHTAEARQVLEAVIAEFGRRRTRERAAAHVELARVAGAEGNAEEAVEQLELASRMDVDNPHMLRMVARMARESGDVERAERSLRAVLMIVRRHPPGDDLKAIGTSEVLYELSLLASDRDEGEKSSELLDSALESAGQSDQEAMRLSNTLVEMGETDRALEVLRKRVGATGSDRSRAALLEVIAELLERSGEAGEGADALEARLEAIALMPEPERIATARRLAASIGQSARLADALEAVVNTLRRDNDADRATALLVTLGDVAEKDLEDMERAAATYRLLRELGTSDAEALFALARVYGRMGDRGAQSQALDELTEMANAGEGADKADALYRLAQVQVGEPDMLARGLDMLEQALELDARFAQAGRSLRRAAETATDPAQLERILTMWEPVARRAGDPRLLLDFLERQAARPTATAGQIKEAVHAAFSQGEDQRGEALLAEAITRGGGDGDDGPTWARIALADHRAARGELEEARDLLHQIAGEVGDASGNQRVLGLGLSIAERAAKSESGRPLAAEIYEFLRAREPGERRVWEPLLDVYRDLGDEARRSAVVGETLPQLVDTAERNALRKKHAEHLVAAGRLDQAAQVLRDALLDDPDDLEAGARLEEVYRESGDSAGLAEFLWQRFEEARERVAVETVAAVALRLGAILDDIDREQARAVFHAALEIAPENRDLLEAVLAHEPEENAFSRADIMERLLAVESPDRAPSLVAELAGLREGMEDTDGLIRALELGNRVAPGDDGVRQRLEELYRSLERHDELAEFLVRDAAALEPEIAVERLREAAALCRDVLVDLGRAAAVLDTARALRPDDSKLAIELARTQREAGDLRAAIATVAAALVEPNQGDGRVDLLIHRAELLTELGELGRAVTDLEDAYRLESERAGEPLIAGLERLRVGSRDSSDAAAERRAAMRLATLLGERDRESDARELLLDWINRHSGDREVLFALRAMDIAAERWDGVVAACDQLVQILSGADQRATADQLADAAERLGKPELARSGLELVLRAQPTSEPVRAHLRALYDRTGAYRELAELLLSDADLADDDDVRYGRLRHAADVFVNDLNDPSAAQEPASRARELRPDDHDTVILLADVLIASGQYDAAREMLEPAIAEHRRRSPELAQLQQRMGRLHGALGDRDGQLTWIKKAFDVDRKSGPIAAELAQLATDMGQYDLALKPLRAITLMDDPSPITRVMALLWEAKIEHARGNLRKAEMWAKKALREDPAYSDAQDFLATLSN